MVSRKPGVSPMVPHAISRVNAGLKVSSGLTSEASAFSNAYVESSVAAQFSTNEAKSAMIKMLSICGRCVVQEKGANLHCMSRNVPTAKTGSENALIAHATSAGRASRSICLFRIGSNEVRTVAESARKTYMVTFIVFYLFQQYHLNNAGREKRSGSGMH